MRIPATKCKIFIAISKETTHFLDSNRLKHGAAHKVQSAIGIVVQYIVHWFFLLLYFSQAQRDSLVVSRCFPYYLFFILKMFQKWCAFFENAIDACVRFRVLCALEKSHAVSFDLLRATQYVIVFGRFLHSWCILSHCQRPCSCTIVSIWYWVALESKKTQQN